MQEYQNQMEAAKIIAKIRSQISEEDGPVISPAWRKLNHAINYLQSQAALLVSE